MNKLKAALAATGVIIGLFVVCTLMALFVNILWILFLIFGVRLCWWGFYKVFKN